MKLVQELYNLFEAEIPGVNHVDIEDLIKHFPNNYKKAIEKLWGGPRLTWEGHPFFGENDEDSGTLTGDLIPHAVETWSEQGGNIEVTFSAVPYENEEGENFSIELRYEQPIDPTKDGEEVYMGYNSRSNTLYVGYDVWADEETFNQEWDKAFKEETGEDFDYDNPSHQKAFNTAHKEFSSGGEWLLLSLDNSGGTIIAQTADSGPGLFYKSGNRSGHSVTQGMGLIDLRLD